MNWARLIPLCISVLSLVSCQIQKPRIIWTEGIPSEGTACHSISVINAGKLGDDWEIWFSLIPEGLSVEESSGLGLENVMANTNRLYPLPGESLCDTLTLLYRTSPLRRNSWAPEGFVLRSGKKQYKLKTDYVFLVPEETLPEKKWRKPDFSTPGNPLAYRGFMLDVARNFTPYKEVLRLIDTLAEYKVNYFHFHIADDEGWRLEIEGLPELTSVGAFHALPVKGPDGRWQETTALQPSYDGCADRRDRHSLANGFYTRKEFISILQHAASKGIAVIPEIDTPGHSRAAIIAMEAYFRRTDDSSMRLRYEDAVADYFTAQCYTDNILPVDRESVYTFLFYVWDSILDMYREAGVEIPAIHIGGDEVPEGAWGWSDSPESLRSAFIARMADYAYDRGVRLAGWQEMVQGIDEESFAKVKRVLFGVNCWTGVSPEMLSDMEERGVPIIISDACYTYADQAYSPAKTEIGHSWAAYIDEDKTYAYSPELSDAVLGIQVQLFTETLRDVQQIYYDVFPKMLGIFDLAWNRREGLFFSDIGFEADFLTLHEMIALDAGNAALGESGNSDFQPSSLAGHEAGEAP